jgi:hypothetical protein
MRQFRCNSLAQFNFALENLVWQSEKGNDVEVGDEIGLLITGETFVRFLGTVKEKYKRTPFNWPEDWPGSDQEVVNTFKIDPINNKGAWSYRKE